MLFTADDGDETPTKKAIVEGSFKTPNHSPPHNTSSNVIFTARELFPPNLEA